MYALRVIIWACQAAFDATAPLAAASCFRITHDAMRRRVGVHLLVSTASYIITQRGRLVFFAVHFSYI